MEPSTRLPDICKTRTLDDPILKVWEAIATRDGIALWFVPNDFAARPDHEFHVEMDQPQGRTACKVTSFQPPVRLAYSVGRDWTWTFELKDLGGQTELVFCWSGWDANKSSEFGAPHTTLHAHLIDGMNVLVKRLCRSIRNLPSMTPTETGEGIAMKESTLQIIGMSCGHCIEKVENVLKDFGAEGEVKLGRATFRYDENRVSLEKVKDAIEDLGYDIA